jgi:hypothetical protein
MTLPLATAAVVVFAHKTESTFITLSPDIALPSGVRCTRVPCTFLHPSSNSIAASVCSCADLKTLSSRKSRRRNSPHLAMLESFGASQSTLLLPNIPQPAGSFAPPATSTHNETKSSGNKVSGLKGLRCLADTNAVGPKHKVEWPGGYGSGSRHVAGQFRP